MSEKTKTHYRTSEDKKKGRKWFIRIVIMILLLIILLLTLHQCGYFKYPWESSPVPVVAGDLFPDSKDAEDGHLKDMTEEEIKEQMQKIADASQFSFKINAKPDFENGRSAGNLRIENPNYNIYPMVVQITLDSTGEIIYDSGGVLPNQHIGNAKLTKVLSKGTHQATAHLYAYDPDTKTCQGESAAKLTITIKN